MINGNKKYPKITVKILVYILILIVFFFIKNELNPIKPEIKNV